MQGPLTRVSLGGGGGGLKNSGIPTGLEKSSQSTYNFPQLWRNSFMFYWRLQCHWERPILSQIKKTKRTQGKDGRGKSTEFNHKQSFILNSDRTLQWCFRLNNRDAQNLMVRHLNCNNLTSEFIYQVFLSGGGGKPDYNGLLGTISTD